jgi:2-phospho-L-lactate guanylyltransferase
MGEQVSTWVVVLVKDFGSAKQRLEPALDPGERMVLARANAARAIRAAAAGERVLVVAGSEEAATLAAELGAEALVEPRQEGQNVAAQRGIGRAVEGGANAVLLLSSDLPLVTKQAVRRVLDAAARLEPPAVMAVAAVGRGGTNALYLHPPRAIGLHFGADSLAAFRREAQSEGVRFVVHRSVEMALDLDEPADLARLRRAV